MKRSLLLIALLSMMIASCGQGPKVEYSGRNLTGKISIQRDKHTKAAQAVVSEDGEFKVYAGPSVEEINTRKAIAKGKGAGIYDLPVSTTARSYFLFRSGDDQAILAERHLPMEGGYNFRDLGGYQAKDGRYVKWGKIFRSDDLHGLTDADLAYLASIPIKAVVDFRSESEIAEAPDRLPSPETRRFALSIVPGSMNTFEELAGMTPEQTDSMMVAMNRFMVTDDAVLLRYKSMFKLLEKGERVPLLFHCSAGKDRTGLGAALILYALGVNEETIMEDYLASNEYLGDKYAEVIAKYPSLKPMMTVDRRYLQAAIDEIKANYPSMEIFLGMMFDVDIAKFRDMYLY